MTNRMPMPAAGPNTVPQAPVAGVLTPAPPGVGQPSGVPAVQMPPVPDDILERLDERGINVPDPTPLDPGEKYRASPRGARDHVFEVIAHELAIWAHRMPSVLAQGLKGGPHSKAPFAPPMTGKEKLEYYSDMVFNPDGSPNVQGRQELLRRKTPADYAKIMTVVTRHRSGEEPEE